MKLNFKRNTLILVLTFAVVFQSCTKDDDPIVIENENQLENIQNQIVQYEESINAIEAPETMEQFAEENIYASNALISLASLRGQALQYSSIFLAIPDSAEQQGFVNKNGINSDVWVWSFEGVTLYYTISSDADFYYFEYDIEEDGVRTNLYKGRIRKDGSFYEVQFYAGTGSPLLEIRYTKTGNTINFVFENQEGDKIELAYNEIDQSGSIEIYESGVLAESYIWSADGTGLYTNHGTGETFSWP